MKAQWGNHGVILVRGATATSEETRERALQQCFEAQPGCQHSDAEFERLARHFRSLPRIPAGLRQRLNFIRTQVVHGLLYQKAEPSAKQSNKALEVLPQRLDEFAAAAAALPEHPSFDAFSSTYSADFPPGLRFSHQLRFLARVARDFDQSAQAQPSRLMFCQAADRLAFCIDNLDWVSKRSIPSYLLAVPSEKPLSALLGQTQALLVTLAKAKRSKGGRTRLPPEFVQAVLWLHDLYAAAGGKFTHTPRKKTEYDGVPRSPAGRFVLEFFQNIDNAHFRPQMVNTLLAQAVAFRRKDRGRLI